MQQHNRRTLLASALGTMAASAAPRKKYRAAVIGHTGHGNYGHGLDTVWHAFDNIEVVAVADADEKGLAAALPRTHAKKAYADYREMLRKEKPDLVSVGPRWMDQRVEMVTAAADAGAHIYMEKPFARTLADADRMVAAVKKNGVKVQIAHQMRGSPYVHRARQLIAEGAIGMIQEVRARGKEDRRAGGEDMMVLGSHVCDVMRIFLGDPQWVLSHVTNNGVEIAHKDVKQPTEPIGSIAGNQIAAMFAFPGGVHGYFASRAADKTDPLRFGTWIYGTKGVIFLPNGIYPDGGLFLLRSAAWLPDDKHTWERIEGKPDATGLSIGTAEGREMANALMAADLLRAIEAGSKPFCNEEDGRWTIEMVHGVYAAQKAGDRVPLPLKQRTHPLDTL